MKLGLTQKDGVSILSLEGALEAKTMEIIKAGAKKLFRDGKNKLALDLSKATGLTNEIIREFCVLNIIARELAGEIVLITADATSLTKVSSFSHPKSISVFSNSDEAVKSFTAPVKAPGAAAAAAPEGAASEEGGLDESVALLKAKDEEIKKLKASLEEKEKGEVGNIKRENSRLKELSKTLEESILKHVEFRRLPAEDPAIKEKVKGLEDRLRKLAAQVDEKAAPAAAKK